MALLTLGSQGDAVRQLQQQLTDQGFSTNGVDGIYGAGTQAAVRAFQQARGLVADGIAGPLTLDLLNGGTPTPPPQAETESASALAGVFTLAAVTPLYPGARSADIAANLPLVLSAMEGRGLSDPRLVLGSLATIRAETAGFVPLNEFVSKYNTSPGGQPFDLYNNRTSLGNGPQDGALFKGRGFVQLTGRDNYTSIGQALGLDLVNNPDLANQPDIAAKILAYFVWRVRQPMLTALADNDLAAARKLVNGGSNGLSDFTDAYSKGLPLIAPLLA